MTCFTQEAAGSWIIDHLLTELPASRESLLPVLLAQCVVSLTRSQLPSGDSFVEGSRFLEMLDYVLLAVETGHAPDEAREF